MKTLRLKYSYAYFYILHCSNNTFYCGSTKDLMLRLRQHDVGKGANFTKKHLPVKLVYYENFDRIEDAFKREWQVKKWSAMKKKALINRDIELLKVLSKGKRSVRGLPDAQGSLH